MALDVPPEVYQQALAHLADGSTIQATHTLMQTGVGILESKAWMEGLAASDNPLEVAVWKVCQASQRDWQAQQQALADEKAARADEFLVAGLKHEFPELMLDKALDLLFSGSVLELEYVRERAMHLCRLANSFCLMHRRGECSAADAQALIRGGSPGFQDFSYERVWQNAWVVTDREFQ